MPICPKCKNAHLEQQKDPETFKCGSCKTTFKLVKLDDQLEDFVNYPSHRKGLPASMMRLAGTKASRDLISAGASGLSHPRIFILFAEIQSLKGFS
jgi:hypothetical protein